MNPAEQKTHTTAVSKLADRLAAVETVVDGLGAWSEQFAPAVVRQFDAVLARLDAAELRAAAADALLVAQQARLDMLEAALASARTAIGDERTHRLKLAEEQRGYVDGADRALTRRLEALEAPPATTIGLVLRWFLRSGR